MHIVHAWSNAGWEVYALSRSHMRRIKPKNVMNEEKDIGIPYSCTICKSIHTWCGVDTNLNNIEVTFVTQWPRKREHVRYFFFISRMHFLWIFAAWICVLHSWKNRGREKKSRAAEKGNQISSGLVGEQGEDITWNLGMSFVMERDPPHRWKAARVMFSFVWEAAIFRLICAENVQNVYL